jgi:hypothetical protein
VISAVISLVVAIAQPATAQITQATVTEILDGNQVFVQGQQATVNQVAGQGQQVRTGSSRAGLRFSNGAAGRMRPNTSLVIGQCIQLQEGAIIANGPTNACAGSVRAATRGTTFIMEVEGEEKYKCQVLEGSLAMTTASSDKEVIVEEGKQVEVEKNQIGEVRSISPEEILAILNGSLFRGFTRELPGIGNLRQSLQRLYPNIQLPNLGIPIGIPIPRIPRLPF